MVFKECVLVKPQIQIPHGKHGDMVAQRFLIQAGLALQETSLEEPKIPRCLCVRVLDYWQSMPPQIFFSSSQHDRAGIAFLLAIILFVCVCALVCVCARVYRCKLAFKLCSRDKTQHPHTCSASISTNWAISLDPQYNIIVKGEGQYTPINVPELPCLTRSR